MRRGIPCPICEGTRWKVCRTTARHLHVARYRKCIKCGHRIETEERAKVNAYMRVETLEKYLPVNDNPENESRGNNAKRLAS